MGLGVCWVGFEVEYICSMFRYEFESFFWILSVKVEEIEIEERR